MYFISKISAHARSEGSDVPSSYERALCWFRRSKHLGTLPSLESHTGQHSCPGPFPLSLLTQFSNLLKPREKPTNQPEKPAAAGSPSLCRLWFVFFEGKIHQPFLPCLPRCCLKGFTSLPPLFSLSLWTPTTPGRAESSCWVWWGIGEALPLPGRLFWRIPQCRSCLRGAGGRRPARRGWSAWGVLRGRGAGRPRHGVALRVPHRARQWCSVQNLSRGSCQAR